MDEARIRRLREEVLAQLQNSPESPRGDLESRASGEAAGARRADPASAPLGTHPSLQLLNVPGGSERCLLEPDKPCVQSGQCRTLGH